jgi:hypothetical protein
MASNGWREASLNCPAFLGAFGHHALATIMAFPCPEMILPNLGLRGSRRKKKTSKSCEQNGSHQLVPYPVNVGTQYQS